MILERLRELLGRWCVKFEDVDCGCWCKVVEYWQIDYNGTWTLDLGNRIECNS